MNARWLAVAVLLAGLVPLRGQTPEIQTVIYLKGLQRDDGGFVPAKGETKPTLRATSSALRAIKYFGGTVPQLGGGSRSGGSDFFVAEACEFDRSFHHLHPQVALITNIEEDHLDCYKDLGEIVESFRHFAQLVPDDGLIIAGGQDPRVIKALAGVAAPVELCALETGYSWSTQKTVGLVVAGLGVVGLGVGGLFGLDAMSKWDDAKSNCRSGTELCNDKAFSLRDDAKSAATLSTITMGVGGALLVGGLVLFITAPKGGAPKAGAYQLSPVALSGGGGLSFGGTFQ